jgi:ADP-heptose:LPS heptosyltransferase
LPFEFHALQRDVRPGDADFLAGGTTVARHDAELSDFAETAALAEEMDLVISVCTSVAHLAGALARPTWVLLSFMPDYRWMLDRPDSPWYPTATLLRQRSFGDWAPVVAEARERLCSLTGPEGAR